MGANLNSNKRPTAARRSFCLRVAAHFAVHESAYGQNTTAFDRLCCKSRPVSRRPSAIGNNRIRKRGFVNQYSPFGLALERLFLAPGPKIFLQQYRPQADMENRRKGRAARVECTFRQNSHLTKFVREGGSRLAATCCGTETRRPSDRT
jgi:hypothetical protein